MKRQRLYYKILIPLIAASVMQAVLFALIVFLSGTPYDINRSAENRFENSLLTAVSLIDSRIKEVRLDFVPFSQNANTDLNNIMRRNSVDLEEFMNNTELKEEFTTEVVANLMVLIKGSNATGGFVILSPHYGMPDPQIDAEYPGLFFYLPPQSNSFELVAIRGHENALAAGNITKSVNWLPNFRYSPDITTLDWMYEPMKAVSKVEYDDLNEYAYWSFPFYLRDHGISDAFTAVSVPLIVDDTVIGSFGIVFMTSDIMQVDMLKRYDNISLMVASYSATDGKNSEILGVGNTEPTPPVAFDILRSRPDLTILPKFTFDSKNIMYPPGSPLTLTPSNDYRGLYYSDVLTYAGNPSVSIIKDIPVYDKNSPYNDSRWGLTAVADEASVFELSRRLVTQLIIIIVIALTGTIIVATYISKTLSGGLLKIVTSVSDNDSSEIIPVIDDGTVEIYRLSERLHESSRRFKETISELEEERRRYYIALINSEGSFLDYNAVTDVLHMDTLAGKTNAIPEDGDSIESGVIHTETEHFLEHVSAGEYCVRDDIADLMKFMRGQSSDTISIRVTDGIFVRDNDHSGGIHFITGKPNHIFDAKTGKLLRTIACMRDITEEKRKELLTIRDSRLDKSTGFLRPEHTTAAIRDYLTENRIDEYLAILIFVENYWYFTEKYGRFYSDALITETARSISEVFGENSVISRECSNEFFIILPSGKTSRIKQAF
jgi:hypothetical protein